MTLACPSQIWNPRFNLVETIVWSVALLAPLATFLAMPKLLSLRRELTWSRIKLMLPLGWLASRSTGDVVEAARWRERLYAAWLRDVRDEHLEGTRSGEVVRDERLLRRTRLVGWTSGGLLLGLWLTSAVGTLFVSGERYRGRIAFALVIGGIVAGWIGRVAGAGAAMWTQSLALGRGLFARLGLGVLVGGAYGAITGFTVAFASLLVVVPLVDVLIAEPLAGRDLMMVLTVGGVSAALCGAIAGCLLLTPLAIAARRK